MRIAIMQPYFFPYIGYFQLINAVDEFVIYDNIKYTKKGWINRNKIFVNGKDSYITLPLRKDSDYLNVRDRYLAEIWHLKKKKMLNRLIESYRKSPNFDFVFPIIKKGIMFEEYNLFNFLLNCLKLTKDYLEIQTPFLIASTIPINHELKAEKKVIEICKARNANIYLNSSGGIKLYEKDNFKNEGIDLLFHKPNYITYKQFNNSFVPSLSIIDVMMFNSKQKINELLKDYELIS